ncbi:MAG: hypothetical protein GY800_09165 [Planctomycetes bacterium]|nr:hypothetical protein [Planctomycetota bacterium]
MIKRYVKLMDGSHRSLEDVMKQMDPGVMLTFTADEFFTLPDQEYYDEYCLRHIDKFDELFEAK